MFSYDTTEKPASLWTVLSVGQQPPGQRISQGTPYLDDRLNGHECEQAPGDGEGQGSLESTEAAVHGILKSWTRLSE